MPIKVSKEFCEAVRIMRTAQSKFHDRRKVEGYGKMSCEVGHYLANARALESDLDIWIEVYRDDAKAKYRVDRDLDIELPDFEEGDFVGMVERMRTFQRVACSRSSQKLYRAAQAEERKIDKWLARNSIDRERWLVFTWGELP